MGKGSTVVRSGVGACVAPIDGFTTGNDYVFEEREFEDGSARFYRVWVRLDSDTYTTYGRNTFVGHFKANGRI